MRIQTDIGRYTGEENSEPEYDTRPRSCVPCDIDLDGTSIRARFGNRPLGFISDNNKREDHFSDEDSPDVLVERQKNRLLIVLSYGLGDPTLLVYMNNDGTLEICPEHGVIITPHEDGKSYIVKQRRP